MDKLIVEKEWYNKLNGSPITQLKNGKWQTYIEIEGKVTDNSRKRFTTNDRDLLYPKMFKHLTLYKTGRLKIKAREKNQTAIQLITFMQFDLQKQNKTLKQINKLERLIEIINTCDQIKDKPFVEWGYADYDMFRKGIMNLPCYKGESVARTRAIFVTLEKVESYARVIHDMQNHIKIADYKKEKHISDSGYFKLDKRTRKNNLKRLMHQWSIPFMQTFFDKQLPFDKFPVWHTALYTLANTGLRQAELFGLTYDSVVFQHNGTDHILVQGAVSVEGNLSTYSKTDAGDYRPIPIGRGLATKLKEYITNMQNNPFIDNPQKILFPQMRGTDKYGITECDFYKQPTRLRVLRKFLKGEYAMPQGLAFHFFRSWIATMWKRHEIYSQFNIGTYLGHDDLNTTNKCYIHLTNEIHEPVNKEDFINNILF